MTFVIIGGGIDLSVGAVMALASVWATTVATQEYGPFMMCLCAMLVGTGAGTVSGLLVAYGRMVPFIATLAMMVAAGGLAQRLSDRKTQLVRPENDAIVRLSTNRILGLPVLVYLFAVVIAVGWVVLNRTTFGRRTYAVGGSAEAARLAGINVRRHTVLLYALSGLCCGIAAILIMARTTTGSSTHGNLYELDAIAAVIIGGTLLTDIAYWKTAEMMWADFSAWLVTVGVIMGWLAAIAGLIDFLGNRLVRAQPPAWPHAIGNAVALILATLNMFVHGRDAWTSVVPTGLILSALTVAILLFTGWMGWSMVYRYRVGMAP
jgi:predicted ABC-type sugar transport system permease subunit